MMQENNEQSAERIYHAVLHRTGIVTFTPQRKWWNASALNNQ